MKKFKTVLIGLFLLIVLSVFFKNLIAKALVENGVRLATGLSLRIEKLDFSLLEGEIDIKNLELLNPRDFPDRTMIWMPKIYVALEMQSLFKGKPRLRQLDLFLKEFTVVKNPQGETNLNALKTIAGQRKGARKKMEKPREKAAPGGEFGIDRLNLRVDRVIFKDYSKGEPPSIKEFNVNLNESYQKVPNLYFVTSLIVVKTMAKTTIAGLTDLDLTDLQGMVSDRLTLSRKLAADTATLAEAELKEAADIATLLTKKIKLPFGKEE